ncbi:NAD-dependent protein deacylase sirtuin-5, mitochondrial isoform X2 [Danio rerio]|uniref:NAD-dependent protein deacylase sirtuin-5, mitochondrial isoform X2 n=3 Tax=Danio rerio TaxID=7955 RepID=A0AC58H809_DANRE
MLALSELMNTHMWRAAAHSGRWTAVNQLIRTHSDMAEFREVFSKARHIAIITGAGVSAESGIPSIRGAEGRWRTWKTQDLATPQCFSRHTSRVWEFYHYRRELALRARASAAHRAIAECEERLRRQKRSLVVITQNIDELHRRAGSTRLLEVHGNVFQTRCLSCGNVEANHRSPICPSLQGKGSPDPGVPDALIPVRDLPRCEQKACDGLLRPHVVWFGETLDSHILTKVEKELETCDLCLVVGTAAVVYPAAMFGPQVASRGVPVAEFNTRPTVNTPRYRFHFSGRCADTLPVALAPHESED